ncbi:LPXTG cell wall anchor domain-containing protein [Streptomyces sp. NPDC058642]|uniref:LPXTG cell wall anchor domain-containing protein n=1 Tax=Streptomyces sp. NPDC058642 TaxID=3346572 RepID=UPI0036468126
MSFALRVWGLALLAVLSAVPGAAAADGWSVAPLGESRPAFYAEGEPGVVLEDTVVLVNRGERAVEVSLRGVGARLVFAGSRLRLAPGTRTEVPFTVTVPDQDGGAEIVARDSDGRTRRVAVHLRAAVPTVSALTVEHLAVRGDRITYELVNRGTTPLVPTLAVRADGIFGRVLDRAPRTLSAELAPGRRLEFSEPWSAPALDSVEVRLTVTAAGGVRDTARVSTGSGPWGVGAAGAVAAGGALFVVRRRRRRKRDAPEPSCAEVELTGAVS